MVYRTLNTLLGGIEKEIGNVLRESVAKASEEELKRSIDKKVYARQSSGLFRTGSLKNSVFSEVLKNDGGDDLVLSVYNNKDKMTQDYPSLGHGEGSSNDNRDKIVKWLNDGHRGIWDYEATNFIQDAKTGINNNVLRWLLIGLRNKGIKYSNSSF